MMAGLIITLMVLSLTSNLVPAFNVIAILALIPLYFFWSRSDARDPSLEPKKAIRFLVGAYAFWVFSYLLTTAPLSNFCSYEFLRFDGALLVGYLPLLLVRDSGLQPRFINRLVVLYLGILGLVAVLGALQFVKGGDLGYEGVSSLFESSDLAKGIFHGFYRAHNAAGTVYGMSACIALAFALSMDKVKLFSWPTLAFGASVTGLLMSQSRSGYVAFAATFLIVFVRAKRHARALLRIGVLIVAPLLLYWLSQEIISRRVQWIANLEDANVVSRFLGYQEALTDFVSSPLIGIGLGRYNDGGKTYIGARHFIYIAIGGEIENLDSHAHNSYLHFLAEGGLVGLILMLGVWLATYRWAGDVRSRFGELSQIGALAQAVQACIVVVFFCSLTEHTMGMALAPLTVFTMVGLLRNVVAHEAKARATRLQGAIAAKPVIQNAPAQA